MIIAVCKLYGRHSRLWPHRPAARTEDKAKLLAPKDGKVPVIVATLVDAEGNEVTVRGKLVESKAGSLTSRIAFKLSSFKLSYEDPKVAGEKKTPADAKAAAARLAAELGLKA